nr:hypothetical protein [Roseovarius sp. M141]
MVRRADFCRAEQARRRRVAHLPKLSQHGFKAEADMAGDVFEKDPCGTAFPDNTGDLGPEVAGIIGPAALSGGAEGLAGIPGEHGVKSTAERPGIEAAQIIPDWRRGKIPSALGGDEHGARPLLPFDKGAGVISGLGEHEAQIQASAACAEGQPVPGT